MSSLLFFSFDDVPFYFPVTDDANEKAPASKGQSCKMWCHKHIFNKKTINKRLPITAWLPRYDRIDFLGDLVAGITVGLTVIPQALAYAGIAGLDVKVRSNRQLRLT